LRLRQQNSTKKRSNSIADRNRPFIYRQTHRSHAVENITSAIALIAHAVRRAFLMSRRFLL